MDAENLKLVIFGNTQFAELTAFYFKDDSPYEVCAFSVDGSYIREDTFCGQPVVEIEELQHAFPSTEYSMFVAVGYRGMNDIRARCCSNAKSRGYHLVSYVGSRTNCWSGFVLGENCFFREDNTLQAFSSVGDNVVLAGGVTLSHHVRVDRNVYIASEANVGGNAVIGANSFLGMNSTVCDHVTLAPYTFVGAAVLVSKDTKEESVHMESPADRKSLKSRQIPMMRTD